MSPGRSYALFALVCLIFSTTWLAIRVGLTDFRPLGSAGLRYAVALPILLGCAFAWKLPWPRAPRDWVLPLVLAFTMFTIPYALIYYGEMTVPSGLAAVLFAAHAFFVALLAHFVLRDEPLTATRVAGVILGFVGLIVVFRDRLGTHHSWIGEAAIVACAAIQAGSSVLVRRTQGDLHPVVLSCIGAGVAAVVLLGASFAFEGGPVIRVTAAGVGSILYLAIFGSVIAFTVTIRLIHVLGANRVAVSVFVTPILALFFGHLLLGETMGSGLLLGAALVVVGVGLASRSGPAAASRTVPNPEG